MKISCIILDKHDSHTTIALYEYRASSAPTIFKTRVYVDTIHEELKRLEKRYDFDDIIEFHSWQTTNETLIEFILFFLNKGYELKKPKDENDVFYKLKKI